MNPYDILTKGLLSGFAGTSKFDTVTRGTFTLTSSEVRFPESDTYYIDQWAGVRSGGGQELVQSGTSMATRTYAGGTISAEVLAKLGIGEGEIMAYLKEKLVKLAGVTRLTEPVAPIMDGQWQYVYEVIQKLNEVDLIIGKETIIYKRTPVFVHVFLVAPVI